MKYFYFFLLNILTINALGDLRVPDLSIKLGSERNTYSRTEVIQLNVTFTNLTEHTSSITLPGTKNAGKRMLYLTYYVADSNDFYTNIHTESREMNMDTSILGQVYWKNLDAHKSVSIPLFLNDTNNFRTKNAAHHALPNLPNGTYKVVVWYAPFDEPYVDYIFGKINPFRDSDDDFSTHKIYLEEQTASYYLELILTDNPKIPKWISTSHCPKNCKLCKASDNSHWSKVKKIISKQTDHTSKYKKEKTDTSWCQPHRNIVWISPPPDAILSSLPAYTQNSIIFRNQKGYHYFFITWQLGRIYRFRTIAVKILYATSHLNLSITSSNSNYKKLTALKLTP